MAKKAIAKKGVNALFQEEAPKSFDPDSGRGNESVGADDLTIPRLGLIQDLSPQRKKNNEEYIEGAEEGMLWNTVTRQLYGDSVVFVPVYMKKEYVIWKDRDEGGGFRGAYETEQAAVQALEKLEDSSQCEIQDTHQQYGIIVHDDGSLENIVLSMSKSQMKPSRNLNSTINMKGGDRWERGFTVSSVEATGPKGEYQNYKIEPLGFLPEDSPIREAAEAFYEAVNSGMATVDRGGEESEEDDDM